MKQIEFPSSFLTGHAVIDDDNRRLIALLNRINACFADKRGEEAHETCAVLLLFIGEHHEREEQILREAGFPRLESHIESHRELMKKCRRITTGCNQACLENQAGDCTTRLYTNIIEHIVRKDLDFKSYLQFGGFAEGTE